MKGLVRSKKGQENYNYMAVILSIFTAAVVILVMYLILYNIILSWSGTIYWDETMEKTGNNFLFGLAILDYIMVLFVIILVLAIAITSYKVATAPVYFIITLFMSVFYGFVAYIFSFIFQEFASNVVFTTVILVFPRTIMIASNLHWIMLANIIIGSIAFFGKREKGQYVQ